jgi:hypothetical protein
MGSRSRARARAQASVVPDGAEQGRPRSGELAGPERPLTVVLAALVQAVQALGILLASVLAAIAAIGGKSYQNSSGIAITAIGFATAIALGYVAVGLSRARRWSRTPALLTQLFTGIIGIYLVQGHRYVWGGPALVLSVAGFVLLLVPPSLRALTYRAKEPQPLAK